MRSELLNIEDTLSNPYTSYGHIDLAIFSTDAYLRVPMHQFSTFKYSIT